jgi:hypothetical protein
MPPKRAAPADALAPLSKQSFFLPNRGGEKRVKVQETKPAEQKSDDNFRPKQHFLYNKVTGEAYAEWVDGVAYCLETGREIFRSRHYAEEERKYDFSPPTHHPNDPTIYTLDLVNEGFIDIVNAPNLTQKQYERWMARA